MIPNELDTGILEIRAGYRVSGVCVLYNNAEDEHIYLYIYREREKGVDRRLLVMDIR